MRPARATHSPSVVGVRILGPKKPKTLASLRGSRYLMGFHALEDGRRTSERLSIGAIRSPSSTGHQRNYGLMNQVDLKARPREKVSSRANRRARRRGELPAIIYGAAETPQPITLDMDQFQRLLATIHSSTIINLHLDGLDKTEQAIIRDIQRDPVSDRNLYHIDFYRIQADKPIIVEVPVHGVGGMPEGVKAGGVLETLTRRISIKSLPLEVPESLDIDISAMEIGDALHVSDLQAPQGAEILTNSELAIFIVAAPRTEEEEVKPEGEGEEGEEAAEGEEGEEAAAEGEASAEKTEGESEKKSG